jgi:hemerythrin-like domain-containing protein
MAKLADYLPQWGMDKTAREVARCLCQSFDLKLRQHLEDSEAGLFPVLLERARGEDATRLQILIAQLTAEHAEIQQSWDELREMLCDIVFCRRNALSAQNVESFARLYREHLHREDERLMSIASPVLGLTEGISITSANSKPQP